ncbi:MAG: hypothetical protein A2Y10_12610 [Planctomycetes bacterium GWF2_41_51]|nr:MAG: hypothetical protein A2Y10_12610 [Planctomycetes bacterium GWF2_41_51]HBG27262.1 hypothetical protein [Phycisphaerales bacterium]
MPFFTIRPKADNDPINRLCYYGDYSYPSPWKLEISDELVCIIPTGKRWGLYIRTIILVLIVEIFLGYVARNSPLFYFFCGFMILPIVFAFSIMYCYDIFQLRRGPWLIWNKNTGDINLPRIKVSLKEKEIIELRQIHGWVKGGEANIAELNIITQDPNDTTRTKYLVACGTTNNQMRKELSEPLSEAIGLPLKVAKIKYSQRQKSVSPIWRENQET